MAPRKTIVVFFHARYHLPLRASNEAHLLCWRRYSKHRVLYVNVAFDVPWRLLERLEIDTVIFDTIFLSMHWDSDYFRRRAAACKRVAELACTKVAIVQDEFYNIDLVVEFLNDVGITHILTCSEQTEWPKLYGKLDLNRVKLETVLTGYVDEDRLDRRWNVPLAARAFDVGYRAWRNPYWLGEHGIEKVRIGEIVGAAARKRQLKVDISNPAATDFFIGDRWYEFLSRCRAVLGVEGGASVLDRDGTIRRRVEAYLAKTPGATFEETRASCFADADHTLNLACLSPRHLEACATFTCQLLLEGRYSGVLEPWRHYVPIRKDYSNVEEALDALGDDTVARQLVERSYEEIVASGKWSYRQFVRHVEETIIDPGPVRGAGHTANWVYELLRGRELMTWGYAHVEASRYVAKARRAARSLVSRARRLNEQPGA